ncbi:amidohydrolase family protein [Streptomyces sp. 1222.5]|uniref:amidohydrolase family protein n=1 Tax=Streptomyces sp. 1222.5 TaxID=1881026 RepID=UPI003EC06B94
MSTPEPLACGQTRAADLLVTAASAVVTMDARRRILTNSAIAIRDGRITDVGPEEQLRALYPGVENLDARGGVVTPGLINAHQHLTGDRLARCSIPDRLHPEVAITQWAIPLHASQESEEEELAATMACVEAVRNGVTTIVEAGTVATPDRVAAAVRAVGIRAGLGIWSWDPGEGLHAAPTHQVLERLAHHLDRYPPGGQIEGWVTLIGHDQVSDPLLVRAAAIARRYDARMTLHISSSDRDPAAYRERCGTRPITHFDQLGILGPHLLLAHALHIDEEEMDLLLATDTAVSMSPWAYLRLGQDAAHLARHSQFVSRGGRAALGCDSENAGDQIDILRTTALIAAFLPTDSAASRDVRAPSRAQLAFELATVKGAQAIGRGSDLGSIEPGKQADLVVFDTSHPSWTPMGADLYLQLVWGTDGRSVRDVVVAGQPVVRSGRCTRIDETALAGQVQHRASSLRHRAGIPVDSCRGLCPSPQAHRVNHLPLRSRTPPADSGLQPAQQPAQCCCACPR